MFLFQFDKEMILQNQPWFFNKALLVLKDFDGFLASEKIKLDFCPIWIQVHGLPIEIMNDKIAVAIGSSIGRC